MAPPRPTWDYVWMETAKLVATRSLCSRAQVGCVLVDADNNVAAASYNGPPPGFMHLGNSCISWCERGSGASLDPGYNDCPACHAEQNAVARAAQVAGGTAYVSGATCMACAKLLAAARISRVVHRVLDSDGHRAPDKVEAFMRGVGIEVVRWVV